MASRHSLLSRQQRDAQSSPAHHARQPTTLPPYEPPTCPLTESAKRSLADISSSRDYRKYEKHLQVAIANVTNSAAESNDRLHESKENLKKLVERREAADGENEKSGTEERAEQRVRELEEKVDRLTAESEKALRDLIDYKEELAQQGNILKKVGDDAATASSTHAGSNAAKRAMGRPVNQSDDEDESFQNSMDGRDVEMEDVASQAAILSPTELLKKTKEEYSTVYTSKSMRARYAEHNDYRGFKRVIHDARNPGENAPPVPHASTWFPEEGSNLPSNPRAARRRRLATNTDNTENGDDDDDEIQMTAVISSLKCPLTLQTYREPYSNHICKHTFEKSAILEYHHQNAVSFIDPSQGRRKRGVPQGPKRIKCPERGCDVMLELKDFYDDQIILRQVKRQAAQAAADEDDLGEAEVETPVVKERKGPGNISSTMDNHVERDQRQTLKQGGMGWGRSQGRAANTPESDDDDPELIDMED